MQRTPLHHDSCGGECLGRAGQPSPGRAECSRAPRPFPLTASRFGARSVQVVALLRRCDRISASRSASGLWPGFCAAPQTHSQRDPLRGYAARRRPARPCGAPHESRRRAIRSIGCERLAWQALGAHAMPRPCCRGGTRARRRTARWATTRQRPDRALSTALWAAGQHWSTLRKGRWDQDCAEALRLSPSHLHRVPLAPRLRDPLHPRFTSNSAPRSPVEKTSAASCDGGSKRRARSVDLVARSGGEQCEPPAEEQAE